MSTEFGYFIPLHRWRAVKTAGGLESRVLWKQFIAERGIENGCQIVTRDISQSPELPLYKERLLFLSKLHNNFGKQNFLPYFSLYYGIIPSGSLRMSRRTNGKTLHDVNAKIHKKKFFFKNNVTTSLLHLSCWFIGH